ncbi:hypothetical protein [Streptomyces sp. 891-h]|uniref:hypothetical protein n=1 Tax=Streptomyces sp. 891-h TaxID=2720714 RepID=UPI001FA9BB6A|nr:hypothetical protein [Streptomyces sp. 891-h]UNZ18051.1 hypothetical protein HC362_14280 [Streptomyces sp. 891-h]
MTTSQSPAEIMTLLERLTGQKIAALQVLGINSLKTFSPPPEALVGEAVTAVGTLDRSISIDTVSHVVTFDLQRTGRVVPLENAQAYTPVAGVSRPTVRLLMADGSGVDLSEPARTKRITVSIAARSA